MLGGSAAGEIDFDFEGSCAGGASKRSLLGRLQAVDFLIDDGDVHIRRFGGSCSAKDGLIAGEKQAPGNSLELWLYGGIKFSGLHSHNADCEIRTHCGGDVGGAVFKGEAVAGADLLEEECRGELGEGRRNRVGGPGLEKTRSYLLHTALGFALSRSLLGRFRRRVRYG